MPSANTKNPISTQNGANRKTKAQLRYATDPFTVRAGGALPHLQAHQRNACITAALVRFELQSMGVCVAKHEVIGNLRQIDVDSRVCSGRRGGTGNDLKWRAVTADMMAKHSDDCQLKLLYK